ncbi:MAG: GreA/GreB family elongation factor [Planctomycetes bacterium]|nr:GreA/GreB family elongation factor [Planctomycetota bacterium]
MKPRADKMLYVTDADRRRLGTLLSGDELSHGGNARSVADLNELLEESAPMDARLAPATLVTMNTAVRLVDVRTGDQQTVTLVYPEDVDLFPDGVSVLEPLGAALLGCQVGDVVQCLAEQPHRKVRVDEIVYQPEREKAFHL